MEADSTTFDGSPKDADLNLPFSSFSGDLLVYKELVFNNGEKSLEAQIIEGLQQYGLIPRTMKCPTGADTCNVVSKTARVIDRVQWLCEGCGKRLPIRTGSFFLRLQCSILQALQVTLAWCADADCQVAAEHFGVKSRVASSIYDKLDELAVKEQMKCTLGGENTVVLAELYPDCLTRLSPDTTDQPHVHRILMIADTKHVPTHYYLHVLKEEGKKTSAAVIAQNLKMEIESVLSKVAEPGSDIVISSNIPMIDGAVSIEQLLQHCDADMQHFLTSRIWRQAVTLCAAAPAPAARRYLLAAAHRLTHTPHYYSHTLRLVANEYTHTADTPQTAPTET